MKREDIELIHVVADYGEKDPAFSEVFHRLKKQFPEASIQSTPVPRFSTVATGFWIEQLALHAPTVEGSLIYSNTAPRRLEDTSENRGREFVRAELESGPDVFAVNAGHCLSFVKENARNIRRLEADRSGTQFRSRDVFPGEVRRVMEEGDEELGGEVDPSSIPDSPERAVAFVDGYGNVKTTLRDSEADLDPGEKVEVSVDGTSVEAEYRNSAFNVERGEFSVAPGSSGGDDPYLEVVKRGGSAAVELGRPSPGEDVDLRPSRG